MKEKHPSMRWEVGDMTRLHSVFKGKGRFSAIVDKVGTTCSFVAASCCCFCFKRRFLFWAFICTSNLQHEVEHKYFSRILLCITAPSLHVRIPLIPPRLHPPSISSYVMQFEAAMDALVHDEGDPWNVDMNVVKRVNDMLEGISRYDWYMHAYMHACVCNSSFLLTSSRLSLKCRLLAPGGVYIQITFQQVCLLWLCGGYRWRYNIMSCYYSCL